MSDNDDIVTLQQLAYQAIAKYSRRILKHEAGVLLDNDPEDLHQMRVGMRRLRSAIAGFDLVIDLPEIVTGKNFAKIGHSLGKLRDLDVLLEVLSNNCRSHPRQFLQRGEPPQRTVSQLPTKEQKNLGRVIKFLEKQRKHEVDRVRKTLNSKLYLNLKQSLSNWLEHPKYKKTSNLALDYALPDLLLPQISQFLLHPGWFVGVEIESGEIEFSDILNMDAIEELLKSEDTFLHELRKSAKKTRYSLELFSEFYGDTYQQYLKQIEAVQEILGQIQDTHVLRKVLEKTLRTSISEKMPELANLLLQIRYQKWLEWQVLQREFLKEQTRKEFRQEIIGKSVNH
ncbi:MAG: CHAD domain-containing protein [Cyanobacteria bacterium J06648_1]